MAKLIGLLERMREIEGVQTAIVVSRDGFILDAALSTNQDAEAIGAIVSTGLGASESIGNEINAGNLTLSMIEYKKSIVFIAPVGDEAILTVTAIPNHNLGIIRYHVKKTSKELLEVL